MNFLFDLDPVELPVAPLIPDPTCINKCNSTRNDIEAGRQMSARRNTYICKNCINRFDREVAEDIRVRNELWKQKKKELGW